jgi:hypothetical protein
MEANAPTRVIKWRLDFWRSAPLTATFPATEEDWRLIQTSEGQCVYLGEVSGKHSDISYIVSVADFEVVTEDPSEVKVFAKILPRGAGFGIISALREAATSADT